MLDHTGCESDIAGFAWRGYLKFRLQSLELIRIEETLVRPKPENPIDKWLQMIEDNAEQEEKKRESAG